MCQVRYLWFIVGHLMISDMWIVPIFPEAFLHEIEHRALFLITLEYSVCEISREESIVRILPDILCDMIVGGTISRHFFGLDPPIELMAIDDESSCL
jgi:hypothetical protein